MQVSPVLFRFVCVCVFFLFKMCGFLRVVCLFGVFFSSVVLLVPVVSCEDAAVNRSRRKLLLDYHRGKAAGNSLLLFSVFCCICSALCSFFLLLADMSLFICFFLIRSSVG